MPDTPHRLVFANAWLFDGESQDIYRGDMAVGNRRILAIGTDLDGDEIVDMTGFSIAPGIVDAHVHLLSGSGRTSPTVRTPLSYRFLDAVHTLRSTLRGGVTLARDASGADLGMKLAIRDGLVAGPRLAVSVRIIYPTAGNGDARTACGTELGLPAYPGSPDTRVDGVDNAVRVARELVQAGADVLKLSVTGSLATSPSRPKTTSLSASEMNALVDVARSAGIPTMAHAQLADGTKAAIRSGVTSIEHGCDLDDEAVELMLKHQTYLVPTLGASLWWMHRSRERHGESSAQFRHAMAIHERHLDSFRIAVDAGVRIALGSDSGIVPHGLSLEEIHHMTEAGMPPMSAWRAATSVAADLVGDPRRGRLRPGSPGDFVTVEGDIRDTYDLPGRLASVWQAGQLQWSINGEKQHEKARMDQLLDRECS